MVSLMELVLNIAEFLRQENPEVLVTGSPGLLEGDGFSRQTAVLFDGEDDQIVFAGNPLAKARDFTLEALFLPHSRGPEEQRFIHLQKDNGQDRILLETRLTPDRRQWFGDTFIAAGDGEVFLNDTSRLHPTGQWSTMAIRFIAGRMEQWVNGQLELSAPAIYQPWNRGKVSLGQRLNRVSPFAGAIACLRFADFGRSPEELWTPGEFNLSVC